MKIQVLKIGIPSKGRLKDKSLSLFKKNKINIKSIKRSYIVKSKILKKMKLFSHMREK